MGSTSTFQSFSDSVVRLLYILVGRVNSSAPWRKLYFVISKQQVLVESTGQMDLPRRWNQATESRIGVF